MGFVSLIYIYIYIYIYICGKCAVRFLAAECTYPVTVVLRASLQFTDNVLLQYWGQDARNTQVSLVQVTCDKKKSPLFFPSVYV